MKTTYRILIILVVTTIIGAAMFAVVNGGSASSSGQPTELEEERPFPPNREFFRPEGGEQDFDDGGFMLPFGMVKALVITSVVTVIYLNAGRLFGKKKRILAQ